MTILRHTLTKIRGYVISQRNALERPPDPRTPDNDDPEVALLVSWTDIRKIIGGDGE